MIKIESHLAEELERLLQQFFAERDGEFFACTKEEGKNAFLIRFGVGGCSIYYCERYNFDPEECLVALSIPGRASFE